MSRQEEIRGILDGITRELDHVRAAVLASRDGLAIAGTLDAAENSRVAAMAATVQAVGGRVSATTGLGALEETVIRGEETTFVVYDAGEPAVLAVSTDATANLGMVHLEGRRAAAELSGLLASKEAPKDAPEGAAPAPKPPAPVKDATAKEPLTAPKVTTPPAAAAPTPPPPPPPPAPAAPAKVEAAKPDDDSKGDSSDSSNSSLRAGRHLTRPEPVAVGASAPVVSPANGTGPASNGSGSTDTPDDES